MSSLCSPSTVSISVQDLDDCDGLWLRAAMRASEMNCPDPTAELQGDLSYFDVSAMCQEQSKSESSEGMARTAAAAPQNAASSSQLHISDYSLPSSSRLPKGILGGVAGTMVIVAGLYYVFKWFCRNKLRQADSGEDDEDESPTTVTVVMDLGSAGASKLAIERAVRLQSEAIPAIRYEEWLRRNGRTGEEEEEVCAVCLGELSGVGSMVKVLPGCGHCFHSSCIDVWLVARASCPVCRAKLGY